MAVTIKKGLIGKNDVRFYTAASPTFSRVTSTGGATILTAVAATHIPLVQSAASLYFSQNTVQRGISEIMSRYIGKDQCLATYAAGAQVGDQYLVAGFRNGLAGTSIQSVASNMFLSTGQAKIFIPPGTYTVTSPIQLPRNTIIFGCGDGTVIRANATTKPNRVFTIAGSVGATSSNLTSNATIGNNKATVSNGALFAAGQLVQIQDSLNLEYLTISAVSGNTLSFESDLTKTYRSAATTKNVTIAYPARLVMDQLVIKGHGVVGSTGYGVAASILQRSSIGSKTVIDQNPNGAVLLNKGCNYNSFSHRSSPGPLSTQTDIPLFVSSVSAHSNLWNGVSSGAVSELDTVSPNNLMDGVVAGGFSGANQMGNFRQSFYRNNKPQLSWARYTNTTAATTVVSCPASTSVPAEVMIGNRIYKNSGTILCDVSRTKAFTAATVGGMDRGPATATRTIYMYAVPSHNVSATRQWDLIGSLGDPSSGPTASATYPSWSYLGAVSTGATVRVLRFVQDRDNFTMIDADTSFKLVSLTSPTSAQATYRQFTAAVFPVGIKLANVGVEAFWNSYSANAAFNGFEFHVAHGDQTNTNKPNTFVELTKGPSASSQPTAAVFNQSIPTNDTRQLAYRVPTAGTANARIFYRGFTIQRSAYK